MISFGLLAFLMTFQFAKHKTERTWFGDAKFEQDGKWTQLYPGMKHAVFGVVLIIAGLFIGVQTSSVGAMMVLVLIGYIWGFVGMVSYHVYALTYECRARNWRVRMRRRKKRNA